MSDDPLPPGTVALVGTPIGNLGDLTPRALGVLRAATVICCEDTRRTRALLSALGLPTPALLPIERHREASGAAAAVARAQQGDRVAVVTDAGMPGVSDPGERIVRAAVDAGVPLTVIPGPTAAVAALVVSGLAADRWCFEGFLPRKGAERAGRLAAVAADRRPSVLYEAPHRVLRTVEDLVGACGEDRPVAFARELTKVHEELWRGSLGEAAAWLAGSEPRGEWVIVVAGAPPADVTDDRILAELRAELAADPDRRSAVAAVARRLGAPRRRVYNLALAEREDR